LPDLLFYPAGLASPSTSLAPGPPADLFFVTSTTMLCQRRCLILLYAFLLIPFLIRSQERPRDTLILHFRFDSYRIRPADRARLAATITNDIDSIAITGYTDKTGSVAYNQRLSWQRANAAARFLGSGRSHPVGGGIAPTPERTDSDNRRVEIVYYPKDQAPPATAGAAPRATAGTAPPATAGTTPPATAGTGRIPHYDTLTTRRNPHSRVGPDSRAGMTARPGDSIVVVKNRGERMPPNAPDSSGTADSARPEAVLALHHINFIVDTPIPTDSTRRILPQFVSELGQFRDHHLEIDGYVNSLSPLRGEKDPLYILSVRRAKFIYDYLIDAGFDPAKLSYKGMGNSSPINPYPSTIQEMNANMRVEIKVF